MSRFIIYMCDYCGKKEKIRLEHKGLEPKILFELKEFEVCLECIELAKENLSQKLAIKRLKK